MDLTVMMFSCLFLLVSLFSVDCKTTESEKSVQRPLLIGSFNIQNLGQSKSNNKSVMDIVKKILLRYDLVLVQEIVTTDETMMENIVTDLNKLAPKGVKYSMTISERLGRGTAKEQYAYLYRVEKVKPLQSMTYPDEEDSFMRPPFIVHFETPTLRDMKSLIAIGIHTQPKNAANETSALADVYDFAAKEFKVKDAILMGDMNAGCANVRISDWDNIDLWSRKDFTWLITHDIDTTLSTNCCPYDRFVIAGDNMESAVIWDSVGIFKYRDEYGLSTEMALAVSDHWPIEVELRGSTTPVVDKNVRPFLCLSVTDERTTKAPPQLDKQRTALGFEVDSQESYLSLRTESSVSTQVLQNLQKLSSKYPELVPKEVMDTVLYKSAHGALDDVSSHADLGKNLYNIHVYHDRTDGSLTIDYCAATTVN